MASFEWPPIGGSGVTVYTNFAAFPATGTNGQLGIAGDTNILYEYSTTASAWQPIASNASYTGAVDAITALTGDGSASGPGSAALTLATVNSNPGTFGDSSHSSSVTVNAKGLVTAAVSDAIQIAESQVTNLVNDLAGKQPTGNYITALTGDVTASGPGSAMASLVATTNSTLTTLTALSLPVGQLSGQVSVGNGGTGASTASSALVNLGSETVFNGITNNANWSLSYNASTRTLSVIVAAGGDSFSVGGVYYPVAAGTYTITHTATSGLWYFYYATGGTLTASQTIWNLLTTATVATVYYNATKVAGILSNELHPGDSGMGEATHLNLHTTRGTQVLSGIVASGYTLQGVGLANISYALSAGSIADEDLIISTAAQLQGGSNTYRIFYQTGTSAAPLWNWVDDAEGGIYTNGTYIYYNQLTGGNWQLTPVSTDHLYVNYWVLATTAYSAPQCIVIMGTQTYTTLALAQAATFASEVPNIGLLTAEGVVIYQITYQKYGPFGAPGDAAIWGITRVTQSIVTVSSGSGTVTSVGLADNTGLFSITGSPVTTAGTLVLNTLNSQSANTFLAAPNGSSGSPTFRIIAAADIPTLNQSTTGTASNITATSNATLTTLSVLSLPGSQVTGNISGNAANVSGTVAIPNGGTGQTSAANAFNALSPITSTGDLILGNGTNSATRLAIGSSGTVLKSNGTTASWSAAGAGTVTSVTFTGDGTVLSSTPSAAVTTSGTVTGALNTQAANTVLAGPTSGSSAAPTFRALVLADLPTPVYMQANTSSQTLTAGANTIVFTTTYLDSNSAYNASTGIYTVPVAGIYRVSGTITVITSGHTYDLNSEILHNGTSMVRAYNYNNTASITETYNQTITCLVSCAVNDTLKLNAVVGGANVSVDGSADGNVFSIQKI